MTPTESITMSPLLTRRIADVLRFKAGVFVVPSGRRSDGLYKYLDAMVRVDEPTPASIGAAIRVAMGQSVDGLSPDVPEFRQYRSFRPTGAKSWTAFERGSDMVQVTSEPGRLVVSPWRNLKGGGKMPIREVVYDENLPDVELGEAVLAAFAEAAAGV